jgi:hypothetical protein
MSARTPAIPRLFGALHPDALPELRRVTVSTPRTVTGMGALLELELGDLDDPDRVRLWRFAHPLPRLGFEHVSSSAARGARIVVAGATGVPQRFYRRFALHAAAQGFAKPAVNRGLYIFDSFKEFDGRRYVALHFPAASKAKMDKLVADLARFDRHVRGFVAVVPKFASWKVERVAIAPSLTTEQRRAIEAAGYVAQDLGDLTAGL